MGRIIRSMNSELINILFVSHESEVGGSTVSLVSLIEGLKSFEDLEISVILPNAKGDAEEVLRSKAIHYSKVWYRRNFKFIGQRYLLKFRVWDILNSIAVLKIAHQIKKERIQIVCSNSTGVDVGARAAKMAGIPHIYYAREFMDEGLNCEYRNKRRMKSLFENSNCLVCISKKIEKYYKEKYCIRKTYCFYNGFIIQDYVVKEREILPDDKPMKFVQVGTFSDNKGTMETIDLLFHLFRNGVKEWKMEFVGRGSESYIKKMKNRIDEYNLADKIVISGFCLDIKQKLIDKDILIMNSKAEGFGRVTVEGMLAGCLVIGKFSGGTKEILDNEINGLTFMNKEDFFEQIQRVKLNKERYRKLAEKGREEAILRFDYNKTAQNFERVVKNCISK